MGAKEVHTEPIDSEILKSSEPMHNPAEAQMLSSESNPSTNKGSVTSSNMRSDSLASAQQTSGHVQDELDKPHGLVDVIEKLSFEEFPEYVRKNDSTLTFPEKV